MKTCQEEFDAAKTKMIREGYDLVENRTPLIPKPQKVVKTTIVQIWEHDRWSGKSLSQEVVYKRKSDAIKRVKSILSKNKGTQVPDTYFTANIK